MLRLTAPLLAALLASSCGGAEPPAPAAKAPIEKPVVPAPPPKLEPTVPGADDPRCSAASVYLNAIRGATQLSALRGAYLNTALQQLVQASDAPDGVAGASAAGDGRGEVRIIRHPISVRVIRADMRAGMIPGGRAAPPSSLASGRA